MTDVIASTAVDALKALATDLWQRTSAYLDMEKDSRTQLQQLKLNTALLRMLGPHIPVDVTEIVEQIGKEASDLQQRVQFKITSQQQSCGTTKLKKVLTTWWSASSEREDLKDITERLKVAVDRIAQVAPATNGGNDAASRLFSLLSDTAQTAWGGTAQVQLTWTVFVASCPTAADVAVRSVLNVRDCVHLTDFVELTKAAGFPFNLAVVGQEALRRRDLRLSLSRNDNVASVFSQIGLQERLMLVEQLQIINREWVELNDVVQQLTLYKEYLRTQLHPLNWADFWALSLRQVIGSNMTEGQSKQLQEMEVKVDLEKRMDPAQVNRYRHSWLHLFTRYMMFWRLAYVSFDVFVGIDFPGKSRVKRTIEVLEPLDEANMRIVMVKHEDSYGMVWSKGCPETYRFLRVWLVAMGSDKIPKPLRVGGARDEGVFQL